MGGKCTGKLGYKLYKKYEGTDYAIYYDHGKEKYQSKSPNLCEPTPFFDECSNKSTLSNVDIVVVNKNNDLIELIAEIEESGASPKEVIGDVVNIILSDQVRIQRKDYDYSGNLPMILGIKVNPKGGGEEKTKEICQRLVETNRKVGSREMKLIPVFDSDLTELITKVEREIDRELAIK